MTEYKLPQLPYGLDELEPVISSDILNIHYNKHHAGYVKNLNEAMKSLQEAEAKGNIPQQIILGGSIAFNGGGHINHSLYWENLAPQNKGGGVLHEGALRTSIEAAFGSIGRFIELMTKVSVGVQGSGWGWLGYEPISRQLRILPTSNHELPASKGITPLLCIDVWEHAYYLQYKNLRADYLKNIWSIVNWDVVEQRLLVAEKESKKGS